MDAKELKAMKVNSNSVLCDKWVVVRTGRNTWRLGEHCGDFIMHGTAEEVAARMAK